jgi:hypothetical protein
VRSALHFVAPESLMCADDEERRHVRRTTTAPSVNAR